MASVAHELKQKSVDEAVDTDSAYSPEPHPFASQPQRAVKDLECCFHQWQIGDCSIVNSASS